MDIKELRIGNYYNYNIDGNIHLFKINIEDFVYERYKNFEPIPISEEWLFKLGFIKSNFDYDYKILNIITEDDKFFIDILWDNLEIKYIHQLQTIYFSLTGEELTIKNKDNNGWISCRDINEISNTSCHVYTNKGTLCLYDTYIKFSSICELEEITHYRPIDKVEPPLFDTI